MAKASLVGGSGFQQDNASGKGRFSQVAVEAREGQADPLRQFEIAGILNRQPISGSHADHGARYPAHVREAYRRENQTSKTPAIAAAAP